MFSLTGLLFCLLLPIIHPRSANTLSWKIFSHYHHQWHYRHNLPLENSFFVVVSMIYVFTGVLLIRCELIVSIVTDQIPEHLLKSPTSLGTGSRARDE